MIMIEIHGQQVYLLDQDHQRHPLFPLPPQVNHIYVEQWATRSDSVEEFLEAMVLEEIITVEALQRLLQERSPLWRTWKKLRILCQQAGDIGPYPGHILVEEGEFVREREQLILSRRQVREAEQAWNKFEAGDIQALHSLSLCNVFQAIGVLIGRRLGLTFGSSIHFGDWLALSITGWDAGHGNEVMIETLHQVASEIVYGSTKVFGCAYLTPTWWEDYQAAIPVVIETLRSRNVRGLL